MVMIPTHSSEDLIESTYLSETCEDIMLNEHEDKANQCPTEIKSLMSVDGCKPDEIVSYKNKEVKCDDNRNLWDPCIWIFKRYHSSLMTPATRIQSSRWWWIGKRAQLSIKLCLPLQLMTPELVVTL